MSLHTKKIGLYLDAAGFTADDDKVSCILKEEEGNLVQQKYTDLDLIDETFIAEHVKANTSAIYIVREQQRMIIYVTESNTLGCVECTSKPEDDPEWTEVTFNGVSSIVVHDGSRIAGTNADDGAMIFYQDTQGSIRRIFYDEETQQWQEGESIMLKVAAAPGTPLHVMDIKDGLGIFYLAEDRTICGQTQNYETGKWQEHPIPNALFKDECDNFLVVPEEETGGIEIFVRAGRDLIRINNDGGRIKLGKWEQGSFTPDTTAECGGLIRMFSRLFGSGRCKRRHMKRMMHCGFNEVPVIVYQYPYGGNGPMMGNGFGGHPMMGNGFGGHPMMGNGFGGHPMMGNGFGGHPMMGNGFGGHPLMGNGFGGHPLMGNGNGGLPMIANGKGGNVNGGNGHGGNAFGGSGKGGNVTGGNGVGGEARG